VVARRACKTSHGGWFWNSAGLAAVEVIVNGTLRGFVVLSLAFHAGAGLVAALTPADERDEAIVPDRFVGPGVEVDSISLPPAPATSPQAGTETAPRQPAPTDATETPPRQPAPTETAETQLPPAKPRAPRQRKPSASAAESTSPAAAPPRAQPAEPAGPGASAVPGERTDAANGSFGSAGLPAGVRHLPNAFTRALAIANRGDRRWRDLPLGRAGEARVELGVSDEGQLGELEFPDERQRDALVPVVRHLLDNTVLLLKNGRFSLDPRKERPGTARLRVVVEITERSDANPEGDPSELFGVAWEAPSGRKPGKSGFILNSGRQVTAWVWVE
jgi:hypothetical protein